MDAMHVDVSAPLHGLPGADLVAEGLEDLRAGRDTVAAALVSTAASRLRFSGLDVPRRDDGQRPSHRLYELLAERHGVSAHSRYNALIGRIVSFAHAAERARTR